MSQDPEKLPIIKLGQENAPVLIDLEKNSETSLFSSVYDEAYEKIEDYIKNIIERNSASNDNKNNPIYRSENFNNIFTFCGERGSGKTSCMQTVAYNINHQFKNKYKFEVLDIIDPSFFDSTHNILELVISQLFKVFTKKLEQQSCHCNSHEAIQNDKRALIRQFQTVKENITNLEAKCDPDETIESLAKLSASMDLGKSINDLIALYLSFIDNTDFLVIQIDDIDLNTEHAYKMIEQIRKYLIQSNIIILMATKLEQLNDVVKLDYQIKFEKLIQAKMMNGDISDYAQKYLLKLIPEDKRINLPTIKDYLNDSIYINTKGKSCKTSLYNYQLEQINKILSFDNRSFISEVTPDTLRELLNRLSIYNSLIAYKERLENDTQKGIDITKRHFSKREQNTIDRFIEYYFQSIAPTKNSIINNLNLKKIFSANETFLFAVTFEILKEELENTYKNNTKNTDSDNTIIKNKYNYNNKVSINQIVDILIEIKQRSEYSKEKQFIDSVLFIFNIKLNMINRKTRLSMLGNKIVTVNNLTTYNLPNKQIIDEYYEILSSNNQTKRLTDRINELDNEIKNTNKYLSKYETDELHTNWQFMYHIESEKTSKLVEENTKLKSNIYINLDKSINIPYERFNVEELLKIDHKTIFNNKQDILKYIENKKQINNSNESLERLRNEYYHRVRRTQDSKQIESIEFLKKQIDEKTAKISILKRLSFIENAGDKDISNYKTLISLMKECCLATTDNKSYIFNPIGLFNNNKFISIINTSDYLLNKILILTSEYQKYANADLNIESLLLNTFDIIIHSIISYDYKDSDYLEEIKNKRKIANTLYQIINNNQNLANQENLELFNFYNSLFDKTNG